MHFGYMELDSVVLKLLTSFLATPGRALSSRTGE